MTTLIKIEYLSIAQKDLSEIFNYIAKENWDAANSVLDELDKYIVELKQSPLLGVVPKNARLEKLGWRLLNVKGYFIFYVVVDNVVEIHRIIHGWQSWGKPGNKLQKVSKEGRISHKDMIELLKIKKN